jgi:hypothetical protein
MRHRTAAAGFGKLWEGCITCECAREPVLEPFSPRAKVHDAINRFLTLCVVTEW